LSFDSDIIVRLKLFGFGIIIRIKRFKIFFCIFKKNINPL